MTGEHFNEMKTYKTLKVSAVCAMHVGKKKEEEEISST